MQSRHARPLPIRPATNVRTEENSGQRGIATGSVSRQAFDQLDDFKTPAGRKFKEGLQQPQAFDSFARWSSESLLQLCNKCGIFHLAP